MSILRPITGFQQDEAGDWIVELGCGHDQHVRHNALIGSQLTTRASAGRRDLRSWFAL